MHESACRRLLAIALLLWGRRVGSNKHSSSFPDYLRRAEQYRLPNDFGRLAGLHFYGPPTLTRLNHVWRLQLAPTVALGGVNH